MTPERAASVIGEIFGLSVNAEDVIAQAILEARNAALEEAAQLADDIDSGKYTATKTAAQAIRALKEG
jgi:hypothetical protein